MARKGEQMQYPIGTQLRLPEGQLVEVAKPFQHASDGFTGCMGCAMAGECHADPLPPGFECCGRDREDGQDVILMPIRENDDA